MDGKAGTFEKVLSFLSIILVVAVILTVLYAVFDSIPNLSAIESLNSADFLFFTIPLTSSFIYFVLALVVLIPAAAILTFFSRDRIGIGKEGNTSWEFGKYFSIFILIELVFSEIESFLDPSISTSFPYNIPIPGENFVLASSLLSETLLQVAVLGIALVVFYGFSRRTSDKGFFSMQVPTRTASLISLLSAIPVAVIFGGGIVSTLFTFIVFAFLNIVFIRVGFLKGFTLNFAVTMSNVLISLLGASSLYSTAFTFILLFFAFLGMASTFTLAQKRAGMRAPRSSGNDPLTGDLHNFKPERPEPALNFKTLFIRSTCPSCGNYTFEILGNMDLKCMKCGHEIEHDAVAEPNITLRSLRGSSY
ncbi:MAG: hypothetical protein AAE983_02455 [Thermoplasmataceae archaeon]|jgi:ribosomal protein S27E